MSTTQDYELVLGDPHPHAYGGTARCLGVYSLHSTAQWLVAQGQFPTVAEATRHLNISLTNCKIFDFFKEGKEIIIDKTPEGFVLTSITR